MRDVLLLVGAGQIGIAIARRIGFDKKIIIGDKNLENAKKIADIMYNAASAASSPWIHRSPPWQPCALRPGPLYQPGPGRRPSASLTKSCPHTGSWGCGWP